MVLIEARDGSGHVTGRCDARCYDAKSSECDCICGGANHGRGLRQAVCNTKDMADDLMEKNGVSVKVPLFPNAMMQTKEVITGLRFGATIAINGIPLSPERSLKLRNHSPTGFAWGYGGSGPAQLALAILLEFTSEENALRLYQDFKFDIIAGLEGSFELPVERVRKWLADKGVQA